MDWRRHDLDASQAFALLSDIALHDTSVGGFLNGPRKLPETMRLARPNFNDTTTGRLCR